MPEQIDPALWERPDMQPVLSGRDVGALYRRLKDDAGLAQRQIAALTGQTQSEVSEVLRGRQIIAYEVLERIATGLGIPRERMGLSWWGPDGIWYGPDGAYPEGVTAANTPEGVSVEMLRRHLIALGGVAMVGAPIKGVGELLGDLGGLSPAPLPSRLSYVHVAQARDLAQHLREGVRAYGSDPEVSSVATATTERLLAVPGAEPVKRALLTAVAELHLHAGWAAFDAGLYGRTMRHYARALELAIRAGDAYCQALALNRAGLAAVEHGHPNDGLKMLQCGQFKAGDIPLDLGRTVVIGEGSRMAVGARAVADSATALDRLGDRETAWRWLANARERWRPVRTDPAGDLDYVAACLEVDRGRLDAAEHFAAASVSRWEGLSRRARTQSSILLATVYVRAGEPRGPQFAHDAITAVTKLSSVRVRRKLQPLTAALEARPGSDMRELARLSQQVAGVEPQTAT